MTSTYTFKMGMFLDECGLPLGQAAELAQELGASYAEFFVSHEELTAEYAAQCRRVLGRHRATGTRLRDFAQSAQADPP